MQTSNEEFRQIGALEFHESYENNPDITNIKIMVDVNSWCQVYDYLKSNFNPAQVLLYGDLRRDTVNHHTPLKIYGNIIFLNHSDAALAKIFINEFNLYG